MSKTWDEFYDSEEEIIKNTFLNSRNQPEENLKENSNKK